MLRRDPSCMVIARGPMPFLAGNKATVGYLSPLTGLPHYSFVGGRAAAQLFDLGLDGLSLRQLLDRGKLSPDEALGLPEAFLVAGARAVVAAERPVDDRSARRFTELFYAAGGEDASDLFTWHLTLATHHHQVHQSVGVGQALAVEDVHRHGAVRAE